MKTLFFQFCIFPVFDVSVDEFTDDIS